MNRPQISFGKIAHRVGAVTSEQLAEARRTRDETGDELEEVLLKMQAMTPELAELVREAFLRACAICEACGRRTDLEERNTEDWACLCGGMFVALRETVEHGTDINPELLQSEVSHISDYGPLD